MRPDRDGMFTVLFDRLPGHQTWRYHAACRGIDVELFFPDKGGDPSVAKQVCNICPVRRQCLEAHLGERAGVFDGLTKYERLRERNHRARVERERVA